MSVVFPSVFVRVAGVWGAVNSGGDDLTEWFARQNLAHKDRKLADRQAMMFYRLFTGVSREPSPAPVDAAEIPVFAAVGPTQTDEQRMLEWARRAATAPELPMISPAAAVSLLPNSPYTWTANRLGLQGESSVWAGFSEAGHAALLAAWVAVRSGSPEALVLAVNCPHNYFITSARERGREGSAGPPREGGICLHLSTTARPDSTEIVAVQVFSPDASLASVCEVAQRQIASVAPGADVGGDVSADVTGGLSCWVEGVDQRRDLSEMVGNLLCAIVPAGIARVCSQGPDSAPVLLVVRDSGKFLRTVLLIPPKACRLTGEAVE